MFLLTLWPPQRQFLKWTSPFSPIRLLLCDLSNCQILLSLLLLNLRELFSVSSLVCRPTCKYELKQCSLSTYRHCRIAPRVPGDRCLENSGTCSLDGFSDCARKPPPTQVALLLAGPSPVMFFTADYPIVECARDRAGMTPEPSKRTSSTLELI